MACAGCGSSREVYVGARPIVEARFRDEDGVLTDPSAVTVITRDPNGDETQYDTPDGAITNPSTGVWQFQFPAAITVAGIWWIYFQGTSGVIAASQIKLRVRGVNVTV
jgi:hypothetical protein